MFLQVPTAESLLVSGTPAASASGEGRLSLKIPRQKRNKGVWETSEIWRLWLPAGFVMATLAGVVSGNSAVEALCPWPSQAWCISRAEWGAQLSKPGCHATLPRVSPAALSLAAHALTVGSAGKRVLSSSPGEGQTRHPCVNHPRQPVPAVLLCPGELPGDDREHPSTSEKTRKVLGKYYSFCKMSSRLRAKGRSTQEPHSKMCS